MMVIHGTLQKVSGLCYELALNPDQFFNRISDNPRTGLRIEELWTIERLMEQLDPAIYSEYLRTLHNNDLIIVKGKRL